MFEITYPDRPDKCLGKDKALAELKELDRIGCISSVEICSEDSEIFIVISYPPGSFYDDDITIESEEFVSQDAALNFLREADLLDRLEE